MQNFFHYVSQTYDAEIILTDSLYSFTRVSVGMGAAIIVGIIAGLIRSNLPLVVKGNWVVRFLLDAPRFPPPIAWIPFVILVFGIGEMSAYVIVFLGAFFPIFTNTYEGAERVPSITRNVAASMEVRGWRYLWQIVFPSILPQTFTGIRIGMGMGWMSVIAAEMLSGQAGLGYAIQLYRLNLQYDLVVANFVLIAAIGFLLYQIVLHLERRIIPWHERTVL